MAGSRGEVEPKMLKVWMSGVREAREARQCRASRNVDAETAEKLPRVPILEAGLQPAWPKATLVVPERRELRWNLGSRAVYCAFWRVQCV
jgi:hypothetical protein